MSISGELEHFPIIDIIQLLHGTRISGVLRISSDKGESQLVFHNGDLVSANYLDSRVRIGQVLVSAGAITDEQLNRALELQAAAGKSRKPLVLTLLEHDMIDEASAYSGIEALIEMTIVEVLTWKSGRFALDMSAVNPSDGYHLSPAKFHQQVLLNAQGILMESLRIFDEKMRDGTMDEILSIAGVTNWDLDTGSKAKNGPTIGSASNAQTTSANIVTSLQTIADQRKKIQSGADQAYRSPSEIKRLIINEYPSAPTPLKQELASFLVGSPAAETGNSGLPAASTDMALVLITSSPTLSTLIKSVCHRENIYVVSPDDSGAIDISIRLLQCQKLHPVIMVDIPHETGATDPASLYQAFLNYRQTSVVLISCPKQWSSIGLRALASGVRAFIPRPCKECEDKTYAQQSLDFCMELGTFLKSITLESDHDDVLRFFDCITRLRSCKTRLEIAESVLAFIFDRFERAVVFAVAAPDLVAELSFGIAQNKSTGTTSDVSLRIPLDDQPIFQETIVTGQLYYGFHSDSSYQHALYQEIGVPENPEVLLFPIIRANRVVAVIYADFGQEPVIAPNLKFLDALVQYTTAQISVSAYRQKLKAMLEESIRA